MGSRPEYAEGKLLDQLEARASRSQLLYIPLTWEVYRRDETGELAELDHVVHDLHVIINRRSGRRIVVPDDELEGDEKFIRFAQNAEVVPLTYSVYADQLAVIQDDEHRVVAAFGGERGGKTEALALWEVRSWLMVGGPRVLLWWIAPTLDQTRIAVTKLVTGEDSRPGLLPPELVLSWPESERATDQAIVLADGTSIELRYALGSRKGGNLKGRQPRKVGLDEACEMGPIRIWKIVRGRVNVRDGHRGQIFLSSTPEEGHWAEREIVVPVDAGATKDYTYRHLTMRENPFIPLSEVEQLLRDKGGPDDPQAQRDVLGLWTSSIGRAYYRFTLARSVRDFASLEALDLVDVTAAVVRGAVGRKNFPAEVTDAYVAGQDFNLGFCITVIGRFAVPRGHRWAGNESELILVIDHEVITRHQGYVEQGWAIVTEFGHRLVIACDATGAQVAGLRDPTGASAATPIVRLARAGHYAVPCHYNPATATPANPAVIDSLGQVNEIFKGQVGQHARFYVHTRCRELIDSLQLTKASFDGRIAKKSGEESDRQSAAGDALRYLAAYFLPRTLDADDRSEANRGRAKRPAHV